MQNEWEEIGEMSVTELKEIAYKKSFTYRNVKQKPRLTPKQREVIMDCG